MPSITFSEYLEQEKSSSTRREYISGYLFELSELSEGHNLILTHISTRFSFRKSETKLRVFIADIKLWIESADVCYYPDLMVVDETEDSNKSFKTRPCLLLEVVAPGTEGTDRNEKWKAYQQLPSLQEYVLVYENKIQIEVFRKDSQGNWAVETLGEADNLSLNSASLSVEVSEIYEYVFDPEG